MKTTIKSGTARRAPTGFTLIELVVVIVIVGILSALGGQFIVAPVRGYVDLSRRAKLVDQAEMALRRMQRDIRHALPNSIPAVNDALSLTMEVSIDGGRYRRYPGPGFNDTLKFNTTDDSFEMLGAPNNGILERLAAGIPLDMVVYNTSPADTGNRQGVASIDPVAPHIVTLMSPWQFPQPSPQQRFYILERNDSSVTYTCDGSTLTRNGDLVTRNVIDCKFTYNPGATQRAGLVTLKLTLEEAEEEITLLHQVHVVNAP
ncbi:prepilin-type N-terminal cleavage/methylation domain-containing protein [Pelovirga terrestris]|uniref:prepilin-type N-terminal cleavage/methylation domain-containing protein n=1 Tax=Pelovirga terrestris TaxID=2771352 RepID=UPI001CD1574D|nr:prepilin-type N-terminal cleavage/methylation domain-containing protein [Pelovirga terrestris]